MDLHRCTELYLLQSITLMIKYVQHRKEKGEYKLQTYSVLKASVICSMEQRRRACRTVITSWGSGKVSVWKILPALLTNFVDTVLCYNLGGLLGYTSFPELHPSCSDSVGLIQLIQCCRIHCEGRTRVQLCYFHSNFANAYQMTEVPYLFFKPLWQGFLGLSINNYFARCQ